MKASGRMTNNMVEVRKPGKRVPPSKETMHLVRKRAKVSIAGQTAQPTKETGLTTKSTD